MFLYIVPRGGVSQLNVGAEWTVGAGSARSALEKGKLKGGDITLLGAPFSGCHLTFASPLSHKQNHS